MVMLTTKAYDVFSTFLSVILVSRMHELYRVSQKIGLFVKVLNSRITTLKATTLSMAFNFCIHFI